MSYGDIELGVECALTALHRAPRRRGRARRLLDWLVATLARRA